MEFRKYMVCDPFSGPIFSEHGLFFGGFPGAENRFLYGSAFPRLYIGFSWSQCWCIVSACLIVSASVFMHSHSILRCAVLRCAVSCAVLRCAVLCCAVLCCVACSHYQLMRHNAEGTAHVNKK